MTPKKFKKYYFGDKIKYASKKDVKPPVPIEQQIRLLPAQLQVIRFFINPGTGKTYLANNLKNTELDIAKFVKKVRMFADELEKSTQYDSK